MQEPEQFKSWFVKTINEVRKADKDALLQSMLQHIPGVIQHHVSQQVEGQASAKRFYDENPDLINHKPKVAKMANFVKEQYPELGDDAGKFFAKVAELVRAAEGLTKQVKEEDKPTKKPANKAALVNKSVKAKARRATPEELTGQEKEIQELINIL